MSDSAEIPDDEEDGLEQPADDEGLSLDELSQAYAELLDKGDEPFERKTGADDAPSESAPDAVEDDADGPDDAGGCEITPRSILEAILFVGTPDNSPLASKDIASRMRGVRPQEIEQLVNELNATYEAEAAAYRIVSVGPGYQMQLGDQYNSLRDKFYGRVKDARLSQAAIDVLAIVAYNQPLTRVDVDKLRGHPSGSLLSQLVRRRLLAIQRPDKNPRNAEYLTTSRFLDLFGLQNLDDLPRSQELDHV